MILFISCLRDLELVLRPSESGCDPNNLMRAAPHTPHITLLTSDGTREALPTCVQQVDLFLNFPEKSNEFYLCNLLAKAGMGNPSTISNLPTPTLSTGTKVCLGE